MDMTQFYNTVGPAALTLARALALWATIRWWAIVVAKNRRQEAIGSDTFLKVGAYTALFAVLMGWLS